MNWYLCKETDKNMSYAEFECKQFPSFDDAHIYNKQTSTNLYPVVALCKFDPFMKEDRLSRKLKKLLPDNIRTYFVSMSNEL
jgi:hypothetical protein